MRFYLRRYPDGVEYGPLGRDGKAPEGAEIVGEIPQDIRDKEPGGKDYKPPVDPKEEKLKEIEMRLASLEAKGAKM